MKSTTEGVGAAKPLGAAPPFSVVLFFMYFVLYRYMKAGGYILSPCRFVILLRNRDLASCDHDCLNVDTRLGQMQNQQGDIRNTQDGMPCILFCLCAILTPNRQGKAK